MRAQQVDKHYGQVHALRDVSFTAKQGRIHALLGPNGAGKSTLLEIFGGIERPSAGDVSIAGYSRTNPAHQRAIGELIGYMPQDQGVYRAIRVQQAVEHRARMYRDPLDVPEILARLQLADVARRPIGRLSGGQIQRVKLALALVSQPPVLFLDEPTTALDVAGQAQVWAYLRELTHKGTAIIVTSHDLAELDLVADDLTLLARGKVLYTGTQVELAHTAEAASAQVRLSDVALGRVDELRERLPEQARPELVLRHDVLTLTGTADPLRARILTEWCIEVGVHQRLSFHESSLRQLYDTLTQEEDQS